MARCISTLIVLVTLISMPACQKQAVTVNSLPPVLLDGPRVPQPVVVVAAPATAPSPVVIVKAAPPRRAAEVAVPAGWAPSIPARPWQWIIIHHTATTFGNAQIIDAWHRDKGWDELGYHFVIGNGSNSGDGEIEIGPRWLKQKWGAHTKTADNRFNDFGIGICLVGNFDDQQPTAAQLHSVATLVAYLMKTYQISADHVIGHGEAKPTDCPGRNLSVADVVRLAEEIRVAQSAEEEPGTGRLVVARTAGARMSADAGAK